MSSVVMESRAGLSSAGPGRLALVADVELELAVLVEGVVFSHAIVSAIDTTQSRMHSFIIFHSGSGFRKRGIAQWAKCKEQVRTTCGSGWVMRFRIRISDDDCGLIYGLTAHDSN